jgi:hypothetical protein
VYLPFFVARGGRGNQKLKNKKLFESKITITFFLLKEDFSPLLPHLLLRPKKQDAKKRRIVFFIIVISDAFHETTPHKRSER